MNEDGFVVPARTEYRYLVQDEDEDNVQYVRHRQYISPFVVLSRRCIFFICLGVVTLLALAAYLAYVAKTLPSGLVQVVTDCGEFRGRYVSTDHHTVLPIYYITHTDCIVFLFVFFFKCKM